jgi:hypothetical protein
MRKEMNMQSDSDSLGWKFGALWIGASVFGYVIGGVAALMVCVGKWHYLGKIGFVLIGCVGSFGQWFVLRNKIARVAWWIPANAAGWLFSWALFALCRGSESSIALFAWLFPIGILQWLVLQNKSHRLYWLIPVWVGAMIVAFYAGVGIGFLSEDAISGGVSSWNAIMVGVITGAFVFGLVWGILTALPLLLHLRKRASALSAQP